MDTDHIDRFTGKVIPLYRMVMIQEAADDYEFDILTLVEHAIKTGKYSNPLTGKMLSMAEIKTLKRATDKLATTICIVDVNGPLTTFDRYHCFTILDGTTMAQLRSILLNTLASDIRESIKYDVRTGDDEDIFELRDDLPVSAVLPHDYVRLYLTKDIPPVVYWCVIYPRNGGPYLVLSRHKCHLNTDEIESFSREWTWARAFINADERGKAKLIGDLRTYYEDLQIDKEDFMVWLTEKRSFPEPPQMIREGHWCLGSEGELTICYIPHRIPPVIKQSLDGFWNWVAIYNTRLETTRRRMTHPLLNIKLSPLVDYALFKGYQLPPPPK